MSATSFFKPTPSRPVPASGFNQEKVMQKFLIGIALSALFVVHSASADTIETVVISATRTEQPLEKTGASITLITADDLKTQQTVVLSDILKQEIGRASCRERV